MPTFYLGTSSVRRSPVRCQQWNGSIRSGDDLKLALTLYSDDNGTPAPVIGSRSQIVLWPDQGYGYGDTSCDYGFAWASGGSIIPGPGGLPAVTTPGYTPDLGSPGDMPGRINFALPGTITSNLWYSRYRLSIQVDTYEGEASQIEGILQVRAPFSGQYSGLGHVAPMFFTLDGSLLGGPDVLAPAVNSAGQVVDLDGFLLSPGGVAIVTGSPTPLTFAEAMAAYFASLPTTEPPVPGLWNDGGLLASGAPIINAPPTPTVFAAAMQAFIETLPTTLPTLPGVIWNDGGVIATS